MFLAGIRRNDIEFEDWMKLDIKYVRERSILLDIACT